MLHPKCLTGTRDGCQVFTAGFAASSATGWFPTLDTTEIEI